MMSPDPLEIHVSPVARDIGDGSVGRPFVTLDAARDHIRSLRRQSVARPPVTVWLHSGDYELARPFVLTAEDSGSQNAPVTYRGWPGDKARVSGGRRVPSEAFTPVADETLRSKLPAGVLQLDLTALGLSEIGDALPRGFYFPKTPAEMELFCDDRPLPVARWPREGYAVVGKVLEPGATSDQPAPDGPKGALFAGDADRIRGWSRAESLRCFGFWKYA